MSDDTTIPPSHPAPSVGRWLENMFIAADELTNAILFGNPHETVSSRSYRARERGNKTACIFCKLLTAIFYIFTRTNDHCKDAYDRLSALDY